MIKVGAYLSEALWLVHITGVAEKLILYFIEYSVYFFTWKMMLKYSLSTIHGR
jgi:hypothetical protein